MKNSARIVRHSDLEAFWGVLRATEPGYMRSLITWMGGPPGHINTNPEQAIESLNCAVGLMDMAAGNRQPGVHTHTMTEIYVIIEGEVESIDGYGRKHRAGPLDCLYIPKGVPHGVRTVGDTGVRLVWLNDAIEKLGAAVYAEGPGPHPADADVTVIAFKSLEPNWSAERAKEAGFMRWNITWVGNQRTGTNYNPEHAAHNPRIGLSLCAVLPANKMCDEASGSNQLYVIVKGAGVATVGGKPEALDRLDAIFCPAGECLDLRALGDAPLYVIRVHEPSD